MLHEGEKYLYYTNDEEGQEIREKNRADVLKKRRRRKTRMHAWLGKFLLCCKKQRWIEEPCAEEAQVERNALKALCAL